MKWPCEDGDPYNPIATKNRAMLWSYNADVDAHNAMARSRMVALGHSPPIKPPLPMNLLMISKRRVKKIYDAKFHRHKEVRMGTTS